jgi:hypothetical protein
VGINADILRQYMSVFAPRGGFDWSRYPNHGGNHSSDLFRGDGFTE